MIAGIIYERPTPFGVGLLSHGQRSQCCKSVSLLRPDFVLRWSIWTTICRIEELLPWNFARSLELGNQLAA